MSPAMLYVTSFFPGFAVYNVSILCLLGVPAASLLGEEQLDIKYSISAGCVFLCTSSTLAIVFLPKVRIYNYYKIY